MSLSDDYANELADTAQVSHLRAVPPVKSPTQAQWERCKPWIEAALEGSVYRIEHVEAELTRPNTRTQFWPGKNCAIITELQVKGAETLLYCWLAGGDMAEIMSMAPGIEAAARLMGCTSILVEGRKGWEKQLKGDGYEFDSLTLRKAL